MQNSKILIPFLFGYLFRAIQKSVVAQTAKTTFARIIIDDLQASKQKREEATTSRRMDYGSQP